MPFPQLDFCIVCENLRPEYGGKLTILGFYGLSPNVDILTPQLMVSLQIAFILGFPPPTAQIAEQRHEQRTAILGPHGDVLVETPVRPMETQVGSRVTLAFGMIFVPMEAGQHIFRVTIDRNRPIDNRFTVRMPTPEEAGRFGQTPFAT